ncbi:MAG TPA: DUF502 domain-containing protein [Burkholderiales bacterium]|nr:DUF502 domain-containing protein [Burkholderiales bacterium]
MKRYFITGLLFLVPLVITVWVLSIVIATMDRSLDLLPAALHPEVWFGRNIPGLGALLTLLVILFTGMFASNILGERLLRIWESALLRVPVVNSIYNGVKQISDTVFKPGGQAFRKALLVRWPHGDAWTIAFLTGTPGGDVVNYLDGDYVSVYVPTTPNPTSGYFIMLRCTEVIELDMSIDEALKYIISMGVVSPRDHPKKEAVAAEEPSSLQS